MSELIGRAGSGHALAASGVAERSIQIFIERDRFGETDNLLPTALNIVDQAGPLQSFNNADKCVRANVELLGDDTLQRLGIGNDILVPWPAIS